MREIYRSADSPWQDIAEKPKGYPGITEERSSGIAFRLLANDDNIWVSELRVPANLRPPLHGHSGGEFTYILEGTCVLDDGTELQAGDGFLMGVDQIYGYTAGPNGFRFIIFRPGEGEILPGEDLS